MKRRDFLFLGLALSAGYGANLYFKPEEKIQNKKSFNDANPKNLLRKLNTPIPEYKGKIVEFFWLGCPHCYAVDPLLSKWSSENGIEIVKVPAPFNETWEYDARLVLAIQNFTGRYKDFHYELLTLKKEEKFNSKKLSDLKIVSSYLKNQHNISLTADDLFHEMTTSKMNSEINKIKALIKSTETNGVPAIIINGEYAVRNDVKGTYEEVFIPALNYSKSNLLSK